MSFGIHFYCLLYARFMEKEDPEHTALFKERAKTFSESFIYWFDDEGKALPFGRSLTYRFAQAAFFRLCPGRSGVYFLGRDEGYCGPSSGLLDEAADF